MTTIDAQSDRCARCQAALVSEEGAQAWCPECEWNLDRFEEDRRPEELGRRTDRLTYRVAYRLTARQFRDLLGRSPGRPAWSLARIVLVGVAVLMVAVVLGLVALGCFLIALNFPSFTILPGLLLILFAVAVRPRLGKVDDVYGELSREKAPTLFGLIDRVAAATGAPVPNIVATEPEFNASASAVGLRQRRVLRLGLPLWAVIGPQQRVALLGHEMGHYVNGDIRRGPLTRLPFSTLQVLLDVTRPDPRQVDGGWVKLILDVILSVLRLLMMASLLTLEWIALRDGQRAEYLADELGAHAAGTTAAVQLEDSVLLAEPIVDAIRVEAKRGAGAAGWREAADRVVLAASARVPHLRQLSIRDETSLFASHPPAGLRARMLESRPYQLPAVVLTEAESARIDEELAQSYEWTRRRMAIS